MAQKTSKSQSSQVKRVALEGFSRAIDRAYGNWWYLILRSFVGGLFVALGATVGFAVLIAIIGFVLQQLEVLPVVGEFFSRANEFFQANSSGVVGQ